MEYDQVMRLISWNVNGLRSCISKGFADSVLSTGADIIALQEVKASVTPFNVGDPVVMSVRPEDVSPTDGEGLEAEVRAVVFMGAYWRVRTMTVSRDTVEYNVPADGDVPQEGDRVHLTFKREAVVVFERPQGGIEEEIRLE